MLGTMLTIFEAVNTGLDILDKSKKAFDWFSGAATGAQAERLLDSRRTDQILKISDQVFVDQSVQHAFGKSPDFITDPRQLRALLDPLASANGETILASRITTTPRRLREQFERDPWDILVDVRPLHRSDGNDRQGWVPIQFMDRGATYVGWQKAGIIPQMFDCDFISSWENKCDQTELYENRPTDPSSRDQRGWWQRTFGS